ncbi:DNA polymerase-3 subunit epsilon [Vibrio sp. ES.051]|uniref:3'-5' exonuclease n=1 Tax=Vibrio sp. ES.051 TaxID=1761909 RepID=UPI000BF2851F|nr:3'-5' exonuclease [Vibrio sp. ES.051]PFG56283.1 DNA polymerase-3 subunit epsilon [Vibrio sp. ES.051]
MFRPYSRHFAQLETERNNLETAHLPASLNALLRTPLPSAVADIKSLNTLVLDFETTGFDAEQDKVLSMGWVEVRQNQIHLGSARHVIINQPVAATADSVKIHHLRPETLDTFGIDEHAAFFQLFDAMVGKILIAHGSVMEKRFLESYVRAQFEQPTLPLIWLDTLKIEQYREKLRPVRSDWRLSSIREGHELPEYQAHNALSDAVATAELYLAQVDRLFGLDYAPLHVIADISN